MRVPSYRRHSSGQARVTLNGRTYYLGPYGTKASRQAYDRLISEYLAGGRQLTFGVEPDQLTVVQCLADYLLWAKSNYGIGDNSEFHRIKYALRVIRPLYGDMPICEFASLQFKACREKFASELVQHKPPKKSESKAEPTSKMSKKPSEQKPPRLRSRQYVNTQMKRILRFFKWLAAEGKIPAANFESMKLVAGLKAGKCKLPEAKRVLPVEDVVVNATIPHLPPIIADMVRFQRLVGCRPSEVCGLKPSQIDRAKEVWEARLDEHKTAHHGLERTLYIGPQAQTVLLPYLLRNANAYCFDPSEGERKRRQEKHAARTTPLKYGNRPGSKKARTKRRVGNCYTAHSYARAISRAAEAAGVSHWAPNQLRHYAATKVRKEFGIEAAQVTLGHSQIGTTQVYAERDKELAIRVAKQIG
jgi:integrase